MWDLTAIKNLRKDCSYCGCSQFTYLGFTGEEHLIKCIDCGNRRYEE